MKKIGIKKGIVLIFLAILLIGTYVTLRGSYLQFYELGERFTSIFETNLKYKYGIMAISFIVIYLIIYISTHGIKKGLKEFFDEEKKEMPRLPNKSISFIAASIISLITGKYLTPKVILYASNVSFGQTDGVFNLDISFYLFAEPLIKMLIIYIAAIFLGLIIYSALYYIIVFNKFFDGIEKETLKKSYLIKHIIRYIRFIAIFMAGYALVSTLDIVFSKFVKTNSDIQLIGAGITDVSIKLWGNVLFAIVIIVTIFMATGNLKKGERNKIIKNLLIIPIYLVIMFIVMIGFDFIFINSNEYDKEKKYIERNIEYTRTAYGINSEENTIEYSGTITEKEVSQNSNIIKNVPIMNDEIVLNNLNETQNEKNYYKYSTISPLIYDENTLAYISPREMINTRRTYNSKTYEYTHGYGVVISSATTTTEDGNVEYIQNKITNSDIKVPQIYYGLETNNTAITNNGSNSEYDYTDSKGKEYTYSYNGDSGLKLGFIDRIILGINKGDLKIAFSGKVKKDSKILINRNIIERAKVVLSDSNIIYDENPYTVVDDNGEINWVLDAYTISSNYPYSTYTTIQYNGEKRSINYIRNSIKVIINAYNGEMKYYITDTTDPIAMAYRKMYPKLFENLETEIPESIKEKFIYPEFLYNVQAKMIEEYHSTKSEVLYRGDDSWTKSTYTTNQTSKTPVELAPYYAIVKIDNKEELGLIQLYTPNGKQNLEAYVVGMVENGNNKLVINNISSDERVLGLTQLDSSILQNENIQKEIKSLDVTGAKVTKSIKVIPIENTFIYVEGIYQTKINEDNIPLLKKVIVASGNKVAIGNNTKEAVLNLVSQYATNIETDSTEYVDGLIQSIIKSNKNLEESMSAKDWELIGKDVKKLQELIDLLEKEVENEEKTKNETEENKINIDEQKNTINNVSGNNKINTIE